MKRLSKTTMCCALALGMIAPMAFAQDTYPSSTQDKDAMGHKDAMEHKGMMHDKMHGNMKGMHEMAAEVTAVDAKTGVVEVTSMGMPLKVHFPPAAVADLKAGDKITLHMGYSR